MNTKIKIMAVIFAITSISLFYSCTKDDETAKPDITLKELGEGDRHGNDHTALVGGEVHIEAEIVAVGTIDKVAVRIHPEGDHEEDGHTEWELDTTYSKFSGLKNTTFHEHVEIDATAEPGNYHFDFIVTDMQGYQSSVEAELLIKEE